MTLNDAWKQLNKNIIPSMVVKNGDFHPMGSQSVQKSRTKNKSKFLNLGQPNKKSSIFEGVKTRGQTTQTLEKAGQDEGYLRISTWPSLYLAGGFNPFEKYWSKWESSPNRGDHKKYLKPPPRYSTWRIIPGIVSSDRISPI